MIDDPKRKIDEISLSDSLDNLLVRSFVREKFVMLEDDRAHKGLGSIREMKLVCLIKCVFEGGLEVGKFRVGPEPNVVVHKSQL